MQGLFLFILSADFAKSGSSWLKVSKTKVPWNISKEACENMDVGSVRGRLVVIKSSTKQIEVENYLKQVRAGNTQAHASMLTNSLSCKGFLMICNKSNKKLGCIKAPVSTRI